MSAGLFSRALKGAGFSITTSREGGRSFRGKFLCPRFKENSLGKI